MDYVVTRTFGFSASHQLFGLPEGHKCLRLHGHTYRVEVAVMGGLDSAGMVIDFGRLEWVDRLIAESLDHRHLNEVLEVNPTSENIANWIAVRVGEWLADAPEFGRLSRFSVLIAETPRTSAFLSVDLR